MFLGSRRLRFRDGNTSGAMSDLPTTGGSSPPVSGWKSGVVLFAYRLEILFKSSLKPLYRFFSDSTERASKQPWMGSLAGLTLESHTIMKKCCESIPGNRQRRELVISGPVM